MNTSAMQIPLSSATHPEAALNRALIDIGRSTQQASESLDPDRKERFAQYFTPMPIAQQMADMLAVPDRAVVGDYGAGTGILGATVLGTSLARLCETGKRGRLELQAYEIDGLLHAAFSANVGRISDLASELWQAPPRVRLKGDFTHETDTIVSADFQPFLDVAILNPPYQKLHQSSVLAKLLREHAAPTPNIYAAFILLATLMLKPGGQMVAIVPRSFCNGDYFKAFRQWIRARGSIDWVVRYRRRSNVFRADNVLQENIVFRFRRGVRQAPRIRVSLSDDPNARPSLDSLIQAADVLPADDDRIYVPATPAELSAIHDNRGQPCTLDDLGLTISTGKIEDFRYRDYLTSEPVATSWAPLVYAKHWERGQTRLCWSEEVAGKPACLQIRGKVTAHRLMPAGHYVLLKRISANDDRTGRAHPVLVTPDCLPGRYWAFENHVQVIAPTEGATFCPKLARGVIRYLASDTVDQVLRTISGTTQINCNDIRRLRFPSKKALIELGSVAE